MLPIVCPHADRRFRTLVQRTGRDPEDPWIGGYVERQWNGGRHVIETREGSLATKTVLEFGSNYGATSVVLAALGAHVVGVDVDSQVLYAARENVARFGFGDRVLLVACAAGRPLPFPDAAFDIAVCNSVLEYVAPVELARVQREIDRVLKPGGLVFVTGTSNRIALREIHSRRWLVNYLPVAFDRWLSPSRGLQRGIWPWHVRYGFGARYDNVDWNDNGRAYLEARRRFPTRSLAFLRIAHWLARRIGVFLGLVTPSISITLRKHA